MATSPDATDYRKRRDHHPAPELSELPPQSLKENVLSKIEDATYEILRKHEKQSA